MAAKKNKNNGLVNNVKHYFNHATYPEMVALLNACSAEIGKRDRKNCQDAVKLVADRIKKRMKKTSWTAIDRARLPAPLLYSLVGVFTPASKRKFFCGGVYTYNKRFYALSKSGALYVYVEWARGWVRKDVPRLKKKESGGCHLV